MPRRWTVLVAVALTPAVALLAAAGPAAADPTPPGGAGVSIDGGRWPAELDRFVPGTDAFDTTYGTGNTDPIAGQCSAAGGDLWGYVRDFFDNLGSILAATSTATGTPWLGVLGDSKQAVATTPWDAAAFTAFEPMIKVTTDGGAPVYASPGRLLDFDHTASPFGPCRDDLAPFAAPDASSAFGFDFYPAPDDASIAFLKQQVDRQVWSPKPGNTNAIGQPSQYWDTTGVWGPDNALRSWDYTPLDVQDYCTDGGNPFCATATFLHCPAQLPQDPAGRQAGINCRVFNANVILLNQKLAIYLAVNGETPAGVNVLDAINNPGAQAPLDQWRAIAGSGIKITTAMHWLLGVMAVGVLAGGLFAGGLAGLLAAAGVMAVIGSGALNAIWGAVQCGTELFKCLAKGGVDSLNTAMGLVTTAAATPQRADLTGFGPLLNRLAGISGVVVILLFLLTLAVATLTGRPGKILPAGVGLVQWVVAVGLGTTVIAAIGALMDAAANVIGGTNSTDAITALAKTVADTGTDLPKSVSGGWFLAFLFAVIATIAGAIIWLVLTAAPGFLPLAVGLMILQAAGLGTGGWGRKWLARGFGILWTIALLRPTIALVAQVAKPVALTGGIGGLIAGSLMLAVAAIAPWWIGRQFPLAREEGFGMGAAVLGGMAMAGRFRPHRMGGAAGRAIRNRGQLAHNAAGTPPGGGASGGGGGDGGPVPGGGVAGGGGGPAPAGGGAGGGGPSGGGPTVPGGPGPAGAGRPPMPPPAGTASRRGSPGGPSGRPAPPAPTGPSPAGPGSAGPAPAGSARPGAVPPAPRPGAGAVDGSAGAVPPASGGSATPAGVVGPETLAAPAGSGGEGYGDAGWPPPGGVPGGVGGSQVPGSAPIAGIPAGQTPPAPPAPQSPLVGDSATAAAHPTPRGGYPGLASGQPATVSGYPGEAATGTGPGRYPAAAVGGAAPGVPGPVVVTGGGGSAASGRSWRVVRRPAAGRPGPVEGVAGG